MAGEQARASSIAAICSSGVVSSSRGGSGMLVCGTPPPPPPHTCPPLVDFFEGDCQTRAREQGCLLFGREGTLGSFAEVEGAHALATSLYHLEVSPEKLALQTVQEVGEGCMGLCIH